MGKLNSLPIGVDFSSCLRRSGFSTLATSSKVLNDILWNRTEPVISWAKPQRFSAPSFQEVRHSCRKRCSLAWERSHFRKKMKEIHKKQMINMIIIDELCFLLSGPLYPCFAYATVYAMPTRPQWEPTRIIPLKVCLRRANARVKRCRNLLDCLRPHTPGCFWTSGNGTFAYATTVPSTFC
jgi:hypothetical protein